MIGLMGNMLPARAGEFIRVYLLSKREGISYSASFATIFIEKIFDLFFVLLLLAWVLFFESSMFPTGGHSTRSGIMEYMVKFGWMSLIMSIIIILFSIFLQYRNQKAVEFIRFITKSLPVTWRNKIQNVVHSFSGGLSILRDKKGFIVSVLLSFLIVIVVILAFYFLYLAFERCLYLLN